MITSPGFPARAHREDELAERLCPNCGHGEEILTGQAIWPAGWCCPSCGQSVALQDGIPSYAPDLIDTVGGFDPTMFTFLAKVERGHYWFVPRNRLLRSLRERYFPVVASYLEIGCGTGFVLDNFARTMPADTVIVGSELHPEGLGFARERLGGRASFVQMDARHIPAREAFSLIGAYDVLEHIDDDEAVLRAAHGALKPGGGLLVSVPQHPSLWSAADDAAHHVRRYTRGEMEKKMARAGFDVLFSTSYTALLLPLMAASRLASRGKTGISRSEFEVAAPLNSALRAVLGIEVTATLAGLRWPAGGSRVVAARKR